MELSPVDLRVIDQRTANVYEAIIVAAKRARQLNDEYKIQYNSLLSTLPTSALDDDNDDVDNPAQAKISIEIERKSKPHVEALHELLDGKVDYHYRNR